MNARDVIGDRVVVASVSGGKDSTAMCLHLRDLGIPFTPVFMDTGWEHAETYRYLREELPAHIGEITWLRSNLPLQGDLEAVARMFEARLGHYSAMVRWILAKQMFPTTYRFCTQELKVRPMAEYLNTLDADAVNAIGVRGEESPERDKLPEWESGNGMIDAEIWRPLIRWKLDDVISIHKRHGVTPNQLYLQQASRVGCWPCNRARKGEIRAVSADRIDIIRDLENTLMDMARARYAERGETFNSLGLTPATFFRAPIKSERKQAAHWPIDKVVEWSHTARGGTQVELFAAPARDAGCMRWGMCDLGHNNAKEKA